MGYVIWFILSAFLTVVYAAFGSAGAEPYEKVFWIVGIAILILMVFYVAVMHIKKWKLFFMNLFQIAVSFLASVTLTVVIAEDAKLAMYGYLIPTIIFQLHILSRVFQTSKSYLISKADAFFNKYGIAVGIYSALDEKNLVNKWRTDYPDIEVKEYYDGLCENSIRQELSKAVQSGRFKFETEMRPFLEWCTYEKKNPEQYMPDGAEWCINVLETKNRTEYKHLVVCSTETYSKVLDIIFNAVNEVRNTITIMDAEQIIPKCNIDDTIENYISSAPEYSPIVKRLVTEGALDECVQQGVLEEIPTFDGNPKIYQQACKENGEPADLPPENTGEVLMLPFDDEEDNY